MTQHRSPQSGSSSLKVAVHRWVEAVLSQAVDEGMGFIPGTPNLLALSAEAELRLLEIGKHLGGVAHFRNPTDLGQFLCDALIADILATSPEQRDITRLAGQLTERLANPLQQFRFRAPLALRGNLMPSGALGGQNDLTIESSEREGQVALILSGRVDAPTEPAAIAVIEQTLETVLGLCLALDFCIMLRPLPGLNPSLSIEITPHGKNIPTSLGTVVSAGISSAVFRVPASLTELERRHIDAGNFDRGLERYTRHLVRLMASTEDRAKELRQAATFFLRAAVLTDLGLALTYCFLCLEAVLLEPTTKDNILSRLVEAIAYRIGTSVTHRAKLRREVKELYDLRSRYVHTGETGVSAWTRPRERCLEIVNRVLLREIEDAGA